MRRRVRDVFIVAVGKKGFSREREWCRGCGTRDALLVLRKRSEARINYAGVAIGKASSP